MDSHLSEPQTVATYDTTYPTLLGLHLKESAYVDEINQKYDSITTALWDEDMDELGEADANYITYINVINNYIN